MSDSHLSASPASASSHGRLALLLIAALLVASATSCESETKPPSAEESRKIVEGQPDIFVEKGDHYTLEGLEGITLGQSRDEALSALEKICPKTMEYRVGQLGGDAWFRGCEFKRARDGIVSVRVGFWPRLDDRVATLEVKRQGLSAPVVGERFRQLVGSVDSEVTRSGFVQMRASTYQMMADWDQGKDGPAHIATGFNPDNLDQIKTGE